MIEEIIHWDKELFIFLNSWGIEMLDPLFRTVSKIAIWVPLYAFFTYLIFKNFKLKAAITYTAIAVICVILTDQLSVHAFKNVFERLRPCWTEDLEGKFRLVKTYCGGQFGFVSSHASNTFGFATLIGLIFKDKLPQVKWILFAWAAFVSYSRIYLGVHFPLDIICGGLLGSGIAIGLSKTPVFKNAVS